MPPHPIDFTEDAAADLDYFTAQERKTIIDRVKEQLSHEPTRETRNRKKLRENPIATWELRAGRFRVFFEVLQDVVTVVSVGYKEHNVLYIRGKQVQL